MDVRLQWVIDERDLDAARAVLEEHEVPVGDAVPFEPTADQVDDYGDAQASPLEVMEAVVTVVTFLGFVRTAIGFYRDRRHAGTAVEVVEEHVCCRPLPRREGTIVIGHGGTNPAYDKVDKALDALRQAIGPDGE